MTNNTNRQAPVLRFKGFSDDWEQRKLKDIVMRINRKNESLESTLPLTISAQYGLVKQNSFFNKQVASKNLKNYILLRKGDFAYNKSYSKDSPYGAIKRLNCYPKGVISSLYIAFKPNGINSKFLEIYYESDKWYKEIYKRAAEGARNHGLLNISPHDFFDTLLKISTSKKEQEKIGILLSYVEKLISLQQRKMKELNSLKQSISKLILENQSDKIRFCKFKESNWKTYQFGQLYQKTNDKNKNVNDNFKIISVAGMDWGQSVTKSSKEYMKTYNITKLGDIVFEGHKNKQHEFGRFIENTLGTGLVSHIFDVYRPKNEISDLNFWKFYINSENIMNRVLRMSTSSARMMNNLNNKDLKKQKIVIPGYEEMKKIGNLLLTLQENIGNSQTKLMLLRNIEKALLQDLFI